MVTQQIEYFTDLVPLASVTESQTAEQAPRATQDFMKNYLGVDAIPEGSLGAVDATTTDSAPVVTQDTPNPLLSSRPAILPITKESTPQQSQETLLRYDSAVQFVTFFLGSQLYAIPTVTIREVIRSLEISRLPIKTENVLGVIDLRGEVTPLVHLRKLVQAKMPSDGRINRFTIICVCEESQIGLQVDRVHSMYVVNRENIQWNVGTTLGLDEDDCVCGLLELEDKLVPILSVEHIAELLEKEFS